MFRKRKEKAPEPKKTDPVIDLLQKKLEYYPDPNRKQVVLDLLEEILKLKK